MSRKSDYEAQILAAMVETETFSPSETITIDGEDYTGIFSVSENPFDPLETGHGERNRQRLRGSLRVNQFLADPSTWTADGDYYADVPPRRSTVTLRGLRWEILDRRIEYELLIIEIVEKRAR